MTSNAAVHDERERVQITVHNGQLFNVQYPTEWKDGVYAIEADADLRKENERLSAECAALRADAARYRELIDPLNGFKLAEAALDVIVYDLGAFGTMLNAMSETDRAEMTAGIAQAIERAALNRTPNQRNDRRGNT